MGKKTGGYSSSSRLTLSIDSLIPENHIVRIVNKAINQMNLESLVAKYPGGDRSSHHPVMAITFKLEPKINLLSAAVFIRDLATQAV